MAASSSKWVSAMYKGRVFGTSSVMFESDGIFMTIKYSRDSAYKAGQRVAFGLVCTRNADTCYGLATLNGQNFGVVIPLDYESKPTDAGDGIVKMPKQAKYVTVGPADYGTITIDKAIIETIIKVVPDTGAEIPPEFERMRKMIQNQGSCCLIS